MTGRCELEKELWRLATAPTIAPSSVYANACYDAAQEIASLRKIIEALSAMPLSGCLHPGKPKSCQYEGRCLSVSCDHYGKTTFRPRMTLEAQDPNILYPKVDK